MSPYSVAYPTAYSLLLPVASTSEPNLFEIAISRLPRIRAWRFSSVTSPASAGEQRRERVQVGGEHLVDREHVEPDPEPVGHLAAASSRLSGEENGDGIASARTALGPSASPASVGDERRVDPAREPEHDLRGTRSCGRSRGGRAPGRGRPPPGRPGHARVAPARRSGRATRRRRRRPAASSSNIAARCASVPSGATTIAPAVEHQLVLAADRVHVHDPRAGLAGAVAADLEALARLAAVVRRAVDVQDDRRVPPRVVGPRRPGAPRVLAHRQPERRRRRAGSAQAASPGTNVRASSNTP